MRLCVIGMEEGKLIFNCPACGVCLSIEEELAGISGPCPHCQTQIQAPELPQPEVESAPSAEEPPEIEESETYGLEQLDYETEAYSPKC